MNETLRLLAAIDFEALAAIFAALAAVLAPLGIGLRIFIRALVKQIADSKVVSERLANEVNLDLRKRLARAEEENAHLREKSAFFRGALIEIRTYSENLQHLLDLSEIRYPKPPRSVNLDV